MCKCHFHANLGQPLAGGELPFCPSLDPFFPSLFDDWVFVLPQNRLMLLGESAHLASVVVTR